MSGSAPPTSTLSHSFTISVSLLCSVAWMSCRSITALLEGKPVRQNVTVQAAVEEWLKFISSESSCFLLVCASDQMQVPADHLFCPRWSLFPSSVAFGPDQLN